LPSNDDEAAYPECLRGASAAREILMVGHAFSQGVPDQTADASRTEEKFLLAGFFIGPAICHCAGRS
jgi:hypothetical protein